MQQAVFCSNLYFLLPPEYPDFDAFKSAVAAAPKPFEVRAVVLQENHRIPNRGVEKGVCMAPFFLTGYHDTPSLLRILDAGNLYPAEVELLSQEEYNERLRMLVTNFCPGCIRYKPLSNRVQSLNGHFEEIALDGFCAYRIETKPSPRCFRSLLFSFGFFWKSFSFTQLPAVDLGRKLKEMLYLGLDKPQLMEHAGQKIWNGVAKTAFDVEITKLVSRYVQSVLDPAYQITADCGAINRVSAVDCKSSLEEEAFRKNCKKYGVSVLTLDYSPEGAEKLRESLIDLTEHWYLFPLYLSDGHEQYIALDSSEVLKGLHYRLPLLRTLHLSAELSSQYGVKKYAFSDTMSEVC